MGETTLKGLREDLLTYDFLADIISKYGNAISRDKTAMNEVLEVANTTEFKDVHDKLKPFIGVYDLKSQPQWYEKFKNLFYDNIREYDEGLNVDYDFYDEVREVFATFDGDFILDKHDRKVKLMRWLLKRCVKYFADKQYLDEQNNPYKADFFTKSDWYQFHEKNVNTKTQQYLVITNSISSTIGMSSFAPSNPKYDYKKAWRSCQSLGVKYNFAGYCCGIWSNVFDTSSLIMYVTDGSMTGMLSENSIFEQWEHQTMFHRAMLRLSFQGDKPYITVDRWYPHCPANIITSTFDILHKIAVDNEIALSMFSGYNESQGGTLNTLQFISKQFTLERPVTTTSPPIQLPKRQRKKLNCNTCAIMQGTACWYCVHSRTDNAEQCQTCVHRERNYCLRCTQFCGDCSERSCDECPSAPCYSTVQEPISSHYVDNGSVQRASAEEYSVMYHLNELQPIETQKPIKKEGTSNEKRKPLQASY